MRINLLPPQSITSALVRVGRKWLGSRQLNHLVRFEPVLEIVRSSRSSGTLLDVGSGSRGIATLLPEGWHATLLDADFEDYGAVRRPTAPTPQRVVGDVRALPFCDGAFDVVVAIDLLEHVSPGDRAQAVRELCRVARSRVVIACPTGVDALTADRGLASRLRARGRVPPRWLDEHLENGFPETAELAAAADPFGVVRTLGNENIAAHERLIAAELSLVPAVFLRLACRPLEHLLASRRPRARASAGRVLQRVRARDHAPTYRTVISVDIASRQASQLARPTTPPESSAARRAGPSAAPTRAPVSRG